MNYEYIHKSEFDKLLEHNHNDYKSLQLFSDMCRFNTYVSVKKAGSGHLGTSFSAMDIAVYLYLVELNVLNEGFNSKNRDIYFSSKGHDVPGLYSIFYALGMLDEHKLMSLRRLNGLDGHPEVRINGIETNSGSLGMGISKGKGMAWVKDFKEYNGRVFVLTGDGEFQEGQIWESLQSTANQKINNITVIIDRNKFQTDMLVDDVNSIENLEKKVTDFGWHVIKCYGNDFQSIDNAFKSLHNIYDKPKFIIADTTKGKGISFLENIITTENGLKMYKWHSGAPNDDYFVAGIEELKEKINFQAKEINLNPINYKIYEQANKVSSNVSNEFVKNTFGETLCELAENNPNLVVLDGDLAADCGLRPFQTKYPNRFIENGIAEQDMVSMAGGMARLGLLPVVSSFASFLASRANEQIYNNACENTKIIYACNFAGLLPAGPGKSHQSVRDISLLGAIPSCIILEPCNSVECKLITQYCVETAKENCVIRLVIGPSPRVINLPNDYVLKQGQGVTIKEGIDGVILGYGPVMLHEALLASEILENNGFSLQVVNMPWLNRIDDEWLSELVKNFNFIYTLDDHSIYGGVGDLIINSIVRTNNANNKHIQKFGLTNYPECGTPPEVLNFHKLDGKSLAEQILRKEIKIIIQEQSWTIDAPQ